MKAVSRSFSGVREMALFPLFANPHVFINAIAQRDIGIFRPTISASRPTMSNQALNRSKQQLLPLRVAIIARVIVAGAGRGEESSGDFWIRFTPRTTDSTNFVPIGNPNAFLKRVR